MKIQKTIYLTSVLSILVFVHMAYASDDLGARLTMTANCKPGDGNVCSLTAKSAVEFFTYSSSCNELVGWDIIFNFGPNYKITMTADPAGFCAFTVDNSSTNPPTNYTCNFTKEEIGQLTSDGAMAAFKSFDMTGQLRDTTVSSVLKPLQDCADQHKSKHYIAPIFQNSMPITITPPTQ